MNWIRKNLYIATIPISLTISIVSALSVQAQSQMGFGDIQKVRTWKISQTLKTPNRGAPPITAGGATRATPGKIKFEPPDRGAPPATAGGATRGGCTTKKEEYLIPLMPKQKLGLTVNEHPTFFWYISKSDAKTAEFLLLDDDDNLIYDTNLNLPKKPGIFAFTLPSEAPGLKVNKQYHWFLSVNCSSKQIDDPLTFEGWVERSKPNLALRIKLNNLAPKYHANVYAESGIWHEAIMNIAQQRCNFPSDSNAMHNWNELLTSVGLSKIASEPLHNVCKSDI